LGRDKDVDKGGNPMSILSILLLVLVVLLVLWFVRRLA
jgi:hypothetical protein